MPHIVPISERLVVENDRDGSLLLRNPQMPECSLRIPPELSVGELFAIAQMVLDFIDWLEEQ